MYSILYHCRLFYLRPVERSNVKIVMWWAHARSMHVSQLGCVYRIYNRPRARICQLRKARKREANMRIIAPLIGLSGVGR